MIPALMAMIGKGMGGSALGGASNLGMGSQMGGGQMPISIDYQGGQAPMNGGAYGTQPIGGAMDMMGGQPVGGSMGFNPMGGGMGSMPQQQPMEKDFMGVMQQGLGSAQPQMQQLPPMQEEQFRPASPMNYQMQDYRQPYGLMGY